ncbi:MAG: N-6 DNA methylase, partial [Planctomycetes bacterium]|nr:N-6 DNA methylase [Planctomycetota bacterium]
MPIEAYLQAIQKINRGGDATEHSYRAPLQALIYALDNEVEAQNEPTQCEVGAPDIAVRRIGQANFGYVECKDIGTNLSKEEKSDQLKRYRDGLPSLILTNHTEFRWYFQGELREAASLGTLEKGKIELGEGGKEEVEALLLNFLREESPQVADAKDLAKRLAGVGRELRYRTEKLFTKPKLAENLNALLELFQTTLIHDLEKADFADMFAQTLCYGFFAARVESARGGASSFEFSRFTASQLLPQSNLLLREFFHHIGNKLDQGLLWAVEDLVTLLRNSDLSEVLKTFARRTRREDPVVHFYEDFLAAYDPKKREARGVYYTPEPVVSYIVRSVDEILKQDFGIKDGLADKSTLKTEGEELHRVLILDPAAGTGTFLHGVVDHIHEAFGAKSNKKMWDDYARRHLLPRL